MTGFSAPHFHPIFADADGGSSFTMLGTTMRLIATAADTGGRFTVGEQVTPVGWGAPRHIHSGEDEILYILEGTYELHVGDERRIVSAVACAILPRGQSRATGRTGATVRSDSAVARSLNQERKSARTRVPPKRCLQKCLKRLCPDDRPIGSNPFNHVALWRRFFRCSLAASNFRSRSA